MRGVEAMRAGGLDDAIRLFGRVLADSPQHVGALNLLAQARFRRGDMNEAEGLLRRAIAAQPNEADSHYNLALVLRTAGRRADEVQAYRRAVALKPGHVNAWANLAGALLDMGQVQQAFDATTHGMQADPRHPLLLHNRGMALKQLGRLDEAIAALGLATEAAPTFALAHANLGACLVDRGRHEDAIRSYRQCLAIEPDNAVARDGLSEALYRSLPPWHFPMLADVGRNQAYRRAIEAAVKPGMLVLDIGTGTGLLAMMAARAGAAEVVACEMDPRLAEIATEIVRRNGFADRIKVVARKSTELKLGQDLPRRADLVVSEILDSSVIGEGMLPSMRHALAELAAPGARVIPQGAKVKVALIETPGLRMVNPVGTIEGFDLSPFDRYRNKSAGQPTELAAEEHRFLSDPQAVYDFDFTRPVPSPREHWFVVPATAAGTVHGIALWFDLDLDGTVGASSGLHGALKHWRQTLFFGDEDIPVVPGQGVDLEVGHDDGGWWVTLVPPQRDPNAR